MRHSLRTGLEELTALRFAILGGDYCTAAAAGIQTLAATAKVPPYKNGVVELKKGARPEGLEPSTYGLEIRCSIRLSYGRRIR